MKQPNKKQQWIFISTLAFTLALFLSAKTDICHAKRNLSGAALFERYCSQCHIGGTNLIRPGRPIAGSKQLSSLPVFKAYLAAPPGHMPSYEDVVKDRTILEALYDYCKTLDPNDAKISVDVKPLR